jgi:alanine racemase
MSRPIQATIHTDALRHNLARTRQTAPDAKVWAVVKANAYGHGLARVFEGLRGADGFALLDLDEAATLRALGWRGPILLLEGVFEQRDLELCSKLELWHTVHCSEQIDMLAVHKTHAPHRVFLKLNSGMNRLGFKPQHYRAAWTRLNALPQVDEISLMTHFSDADDAKGIAQQLAAFNAATQDLPGTWAQRRAPAWCRTGFARASCCTGPRPISPNTAPRIGACSQPCRCARALWRRRSCAPVTPWVTAPPSRRPLRCVSAS